MLSYFPTCFADHARLQAEKVVPLKKVDCINAVPVCCLHVQWITQQNTIGPFGSTFCERNPFGKIGAIEPPFAVLIVGKRSGSTALNFLKRHPSGKFGDIRRPFAVLVVRIPPPSENLVLSNRPCLLSVFALNTPAVR